MQFDWKILKPGVGLTAREESLAEEICNHFLTAGAGIPDHQKRVSLGKDRKLLNQLTQIGLIKNNWNRYFPAFPALYFVNDPIRELLVENLDLVFRAVKALYEIAPETFAIGRIQDHAARLSPRFGYDMFHRATLFTQDFRSFFQIELPVNPGTALVTTISAANDNVIDYENLEQAWRTELSTHPRPQLYPQSPTPTDAPEPKPTENVRNDVRTSFGVDAELVRRRERIEAAARALSDKPSNVDLLAFNDYAQALTDLIQNPKTQKPLTISIDGAWGSGKTSLMEMIRTKLDRKRERGTNEPKVHTVWFNAWKYDQEESLWAALALEILSQVRNELGLRERTLLWLKLNHKRFDGLKLLGDFARFVLLPFAATLLAVLCVGGWHRWIDSSINPLKWRILIGGGGALGALSLLAKKVANALIRPFDLNISRYVHNPRYKQRLGFLHEFENDFKDVINVVTDCGRSPLVIFIDDLDRCEPTKPVEIIEAINQLLDADSCVFILGMDARNVAASVQAKYQGFHESAGDGKSRASMIGYQFLEKIVQIPFRLPKTNQTLLSKLVDWNLNPQPPPSTQQQIVVSEAEQLIVAAEQEGKPLQDAAASVQQARPDIPAEAVAEAKRNIFARTFDDDTEVRRAIYEVLPFLEQNARKVKRFINLFRLNVLIANRRGLLETGAIEIGRLAKWLVVAVRWPDFVDLLFDRPFFSRLLAAYELHAKSFGTSHPPTTEAARALLGPYLDDPRIKRFLAEAELFNLLGSLQGKRISIDALADSLLPYVELSAGTRALPSA